MENYDVAVVGGGVMGCSTALYLSRNRMRTIVIDRGALCREASGTNAGTLTLNMTRAALIPYAIKAGNFGIVLKNGFSAVLAPEKSTGFHSHSPKRRKNYYMTVFKHGRLWEHQ